MIRRHHYERAFEDYLRTRRIPYVAVDEARKTLLPPGREESADTLKSFDFVLYGESANLLVDVKGRRVGGKDRPRTTDFSVRRLEAWVTEDDVSSLRRWQSLFGPQFEAAFVFIYWCAAQPPDALFQEVFEFSGQWYALRTVRVEDYQLAMKPRSPRWRTVSVPGRVFERISQPLAPALAGVWPAVAAESGLLWPDPGPIDAALLPLGASIGSR